MTGFTYGIVETEFEVRIGNVVEREVMGQGGWQGVEIAPKRVAPSVPYDVAALVEEGDRWDGLS